MPKWLKWIFIVALSLLFVLSFTSFIFIKSKDHQRISFISLHPSYQVRVNSDILKQVMEIDPQGAPTTWSRDGDQFAARKIWVILLPNPQSKSDPLNQPVDTPETAYSLSWRQFSHTDILFIRLNSVGLRVWDPNVKSFILNSAILQEIVKKYPTGGLSDTEVFSRLDNIYLQSSVYPAEVRNR